MPKARKYRVPIGRGEKHLSRLVPTRTKSIALLTVRVTVSQLIYTGWDSAGYRHNDGSSYVRRLTQARGQRAKAGYGHAGGAAGYIRVGAGETPETSRLDAPAASRIKTVGTLATRRRLDSRATHVYCVYGKIKICKHNTYDIFECIIIIIISAGKISSRCLQLLLYSALHVKKIQQYI